MFQIKNVSKKYGEEFALNNISMSIGKGLHFIVGASGSGKTTLLKILSGMEQDFEGEVYYGDKNIKKLSDQEKSNFYNQIFGFVWQDFNLIEEATVMENVLLPSYLKQKVNRKTAENILFDLKISDLANQKVKSLSGGQKQRVAIARELMKHPQVIIADEPTSALDEKTTKSTMEILRDISKHRTVIVVTHDTSLITDKDPVFELDKGELIGGPAQHEIKVQPLKKSLPSALSFKNAISLSKTNLKNKVSRYLVAVLSLMIAGVLLLTSVSGAIGQKSDSEFNQLLETFGDSVLNMTIAGRVMGAGDGDSQTSTSNLDFGKLYEKYAHDDRVDFVVFAKNFFGIEITADGHTYSIKNTGMASKINKMLAGTLPENDKNEVIVNDSFVKQMGITNEEAIGKPIEFKTTIMNWDSGSPVEKDVKIHATITGVADASVIFEQDNGAPNKKYVLDDAFFFSKAALEEMRNQAGITDEKQDFIIRAKTPKDMISLKDELNQQGINPLARFDLIEDLVRMNSQTTEQSATASIVIGILSTLMIVAVFLFTGFMRKREYAIYKVSGFHNTQLHILNVTETLCYMLSAILLMYITSPLLNKATMNLFGVDILNVKMLLTGTGLILGSSVIAFMMTMMTYLKTNVATALKAGEKA